jgi:hypothetical protein
MNDATATLEAPTKSAEVSAPGKESAVTPQGLDSIFSELDTMETEATTPRPGPKKTEKTVEKPVEKTIEQKPIDQQKADAEKAALDTQQKPGEEAKPVRAAELRTAYEKSKVTLKERDATIQQLTAKIQNLEARPAEDPEKKAVTEKLTAAEKRLAEYEQHLALVDYQKSSDFQTKFWKPYESAMGNAIRDLEDVTYETNEGDKKPVTSETITWLASQKPAAAALAAKNMFGDLAAFVTQRIDRIRETAQAMSGAVEEHKKFAGEHQKNFQQQVLQHQQKIHTAYSSETKSWQEKLPNWFKPRDGDTEGNALLAKGYELVDQAFSGNGNLTPEARAQVHAQVALKAAAAPRLALDLKRAKSKIKELQAIVDDYETSEPAAGAGSKTRQAAGGNGDMLGDALNEIEAIDRKAK